MNWKLLTAIILSVVVGFVGFTAFMLWRSGTSFTPETFMAYIIGQSAATMTGLVAFIVEKWTYVVSAIIGIPTAIATIYKFVSSKINSVKSEKETQLAEVQQVAIQERREMGKLLEEKETEISQLRTKVETQKDLAQDYETSQQLNTQLRTQNGQLQSTVAVYERQGTIDYVRMLQESLRKNNIPIPQPETTVITVVK